MKLNARPVSMLFPSSFHSIIFGRRLSLYVIGRSVHFRDPKSNAVLPASPREKHLVVPVALEPVAREVETQAARMRERTREQLGAVTRHRFIAHNAPVFAGTRIPTRAVWNLHRAGYDVDRIVQEYPRLTPKDVRAAIAFETERRAKAAE